MVKGNPFYDHTKKERKPYELPPVQGVIAPNNPLYNERLKMCERMNGSNPNSTTKPQDQRSKRPLYQSIFKSSDIQQSPIEKTIRMLDKILSGERLFTMQTKS